MPEIRQGRKNMGVRQYRKNGIRMHFILKTVVFSFLWIAIIFGGEPAMGAGSGSGNNYYADINSGSDITGDGSEFNPWQTIHFAIAQLLPGDTLFIQPAGGMSYSIANGEDDSDLTLYPPDESGEIRIIGNGADPSEVVIDGAGASSWQSAIRLYDETGKPVRYIIENLSICNFSGRGLDFEYDSNTFVGNCLIYQNAEAGITLGNTGHQVQDCVIFDNGASGYPGTGIAVYSDNNDIFGNTIYCTGSASFPQGHGIDISGGGSRVHSNEIYGHTSGTNAAGIGIMGAADVYDNDIHDNATGIYISDGAPEIFRNLLKDNTTGIYLSYFYLENSPRIINNLITGDTVTPSTSIGIDIYGAPTGATPPVMIYHNTIYGASTRAIQCYVDNTGGAIAPDIYYNILSHTTGGYGIYQLTGSSAPAIEYNLFYGVGSYLGDYFIDGTGLQDLSSTTNLIATDPQFIDAANGNCRLELSSPAIDAIATASHNGAVNEDYERVSRPQDNPLAGGGYDMGCFEAYVFYDATIIWDGGGGDTNWSTPDNWNTNLVPAATDRVSIPNGFDVSLDASATVRSIENHGSLTLLSAQVLSAVNDGFYSFFVNATDGEIEGDGTLTVTAADSAVNFGTLAPGTSAGALTITGENRFDNSSTLEIEIGGTTPGTEFDTLTISGHWDAGGALAVTLINDFEPEIGNVFEIMYFDSVSGEPHSVILPLLPEDKIWKQTLDTTSTPNKIVLEVLAANAGGTGTSSDPYLIETPEQLDHIRKMPDRHFRQIADIDLSGYASGDGWDPVGEDGNCFTGSYDGNGFAITSLIIDRPSEENIGLFACLGWGGVLKNVTLNMVSITGYANVGALAGKNDGKIANCSANAGGVFGISSSYSCVGGLVGNNMGNIERCQTNVTTNGPQNSGGLAGNHENGTISQSFALGAVGGTSYIGGLIGYIGYGQTINCFAGGEVTGTEYVGGLAGYTYDALVINCYAAGAVTGVSETGGLIGYDYEFSSSIFTNCYYDTVTSGQGDTGKGEPKTTAEMQSGTPTASIYTNWYPFIWDFAPTDAYPILRWTTWDITAGWTYPDSLDDTVNAEPWPQGGIDPVVAIADNGDTIIVWSQVNDTTGYRSVYKNEYQSGTGWSGPEMVSPDNGFDAEMPRVAMNGSGSAVIAWVQQNDGTYDRIYAMDNFTGSWPMIPAYISPETGYDATSPHVSISGNGDAMVVWEQSDSSFTEIYGAEYRFGTWMAPMSYSGDVDYNNALNPHCAMSSNGETVIVWEQSDGTNYRIFRSEYRVDPPPASWSSPVAMSDAGVNADTPRIAMADDGHGVVVWRQGGTFYDLYMTEYRGSGWTANTRINPDGADVYNPWVSMSANGDSLIVWNQEEESTYSQRVFMSEYRGSAWTHPATRYDYISPAGYVAQNPHAAMDSIGNSVIAWYVEDDDIGTGWAAMMEYRDSVWRHPVDLPPVGQIDYYSSTPYSPWAAVADNGDAVLAWDLYVGEDELYLPVWRLYKADLRSGVPSMFTLTADIYPAGEGTVFSDPAGIDCPAVDCEYGFAAGSSVDVTASSTGSMTFAYWLVDGGPDRFTDNPLTVSMDAAHSVTAVFSPFAGGIGTDVDPFQVTTVEHLTAVGDYPDSQFILNNNLDLDVPPWNQSPGWVPIGTPVNPFTGVFNGNCRLINGLTIDRPTETHIGLFGCVEEGGTVNNILLLDVEVNGLDAVGALVGQNNGGAVLQCAATGVVTGDGSLAGGVGGLVGDNLFNISDGVISDSYAAVSVVASGDYVGGLAGTNSGTIVNCYATGNVAVGGASVAVGGLVGESTGAVIDSYWNSETSGQGSSGGGSALTSSEMRLNASFSGWDFVYTWGGEMGDNDFPWLQCLGQVLFDLNYAAGPNGSVDTANQLLRHGQGGDPVLATPDPGYAFHGWSDGRSDNPREDTAVAHVNVTANFGLPFTPALPDTGQLECYDDGTVGIITCPASGNAYYGQDHQYQPQHPRSYTKLGAGGGELPDGELHADDGGEWIMTRDNVTGLVWEIKTVANSSDTYTWDDASAVFIAGLNAGGFGGFTDWRLPTVKELASLANQGVWDPSIDSNWFPNTGWDYYWSVTPHAELTDIFWGIHFGRGWDGGENRSTPHYVRAVRGGVSDIFDDAVSFGRLVDNGDGTVTDTGTGLMWQQITDSMAYDWEGALDYAENTLSLAGYTDWRLPNLNELRSLVDYTRYDAVVHPLWFPDISQFYWSSTSYAAWPSAACGMNFMDGDDFEPTKDTTQYVRSVRGGQSGTAGDQVIFGPARGGDYAIGDPLVIAWDNTAFGSATDVKILLSRDGGATFTELIASTPNDGEYADWMVTDPATANGVLRIEDALSSATYQEIGFFSLGSVYNVFVTVEGSGSGVVFSDPAAIDCPANSCAGVFADGTLVELEAVEDPGSIFAGWSGGPCSGTGLCDFTISSSVSVTATFESEPAPLGALPSLPDTGQSACYDDAGEIACPASGSAFYGQDHQYQPQHPRSYTKLGFGGIELDEGADHVDDGGDWIMTRDNVTGLIWELKTVANDYLQYTVANAQGIHVGNLNSDEFGGFTDWRLPTAKELATLVNMGQSTTPATDIAWFPNTRSDQPYWSSTVYANDPVESWFVDFGSFYGAGIDGVTNNLNAFYVRAVRDALTSSGVFEDAVASGRMVDNGDGTITDTALGLMWQQDTDPVGLCDWETAFTTAEGLVLGGHEDWRLPNRNELQSLADHTIGSYSGGADPSIDALFDPTFTDYHYWASTTAASGPSDAWRVYFDIGSANTEPKTSPGYVRCVRGGQFGNIQGLWITSPARGGVYETTLPITWTPAGMGDGVDILLSRDGGLTSETIVSGIPDSGSYDWPITGAGTFNGIVKIVNAVDPASHQTIGLFTIVGTTTTIDPGNYYVDSVDGDDANDGTSWLSAWQTLHHAIDQINDGEAGSEGDTYTLYLRDGSVFAPVAAAGLEPDDPLFITQNYLSIIGDGTGAFIDGSGASAGGWSDGLDIQSANQVVIQNLDIANFNANGIYMGSAGYCSVENCRIHSNGHNGIAMAYGMTDPAAQSMGNIVQNGCEIYENGEAGIYIYNGIGNQIINNPGSVYDNGTSSDPGYGIMIESDPGYGSYGHSSTDTLVENNSISWTGGSTFVQGTGVFISGPGYGPSTNTELIQNVISLHPESGIALYNASARVKRNTIVDNNVGIRIEASGSGYNAGGAFWNNLIYDDAATSDFSMIYGFTMTAANSGNINYPTLYHNTLYGGSGDGVNIDITGGISSTEPSIFANIISGFDGYGVSYAGGGSVSLSFNDLYGNLGPYSGCGPGSNDIYDEPLFINAEGGDFTIDPENSPCIDWIPSGTSPVCADLEHPETTPCWRPQPSGGNHDIGCHEMEVEPPLEPGNYWVDQAVTGPGAGTELEPWQSLSDAVNRINGGLAGTYTLHLAGGTYQTTTGGGNQPDETLIITQSNVTIIGAGAGTTVLDGTGAANWNNGIEVAGASGVVIQNLTVQNFYAYGIYLNEAVDCRFENCMIFGNAYYGIYLYRGSGCIIDACNIYNNEWDGVLIEEGTAHIFQNGCQVYANLWDGVVIENATDCILDACLVYENNWEGVLIRYGSGHEFLAGCEIYENGSVGYQGSGIFIDEATGVVVDACRIYGNLANGIYIDQGADHLIQNNCEIFNNEYNGISIYNSAANQIVDLVTSIYDNGNTEWGGVGIWIYGSGSTDNLIAGNSIYRTATEDYFQEIGVQISHAGTGNRVIGNTIYGHQEDEGSEFDGFGIEVVNCSPDVMKNVLYDNSEAVVVLVEDGGTAAPNIWNNLIYNDVETPDAGMQTGVMLEIEYGGQYQGPFTGTLSPLVYHNTIDGASGAGIMIDVDSDGGLGQPVIEYNIISNTGGWGIANTAGYADPAVGRNNIWNTGVSGSDYYLNFVVDPTEDIHDDPLYVDAAGANYRLQNLPLASVCIDYSDISTDPEVLEDIDGTARPQPQELGGEFDIGCYETALGLTHTVNFISRSGGTVIGNTAQIVAHGANCTQVEARPLAGYEFIGWSGDYESGATFLTVTNVTADMTLYANFREITATTWTVRFEANSGGRIAGDAIQSVEDGDDTAEVEAVADEGFRFFRWTGGYTGTDNPLTLTNVRSNMTVTANFESETFFTVNFEAGPGGRVAGETSQNIISGENCSQVTAIPDDGYEFIGWSGDYEGPVNPLTITNVTADRNITANFRILTYIVVIEAGEGGDIEGITEQKIDHGSATTTITAVPQEGYHFTGWSGDHEGEENPLVLPDVTSDLRIIASFEINMYDVIFNAGTGGRISGESIQEVAHGQSCSPVSAVPDTGYIFSGWTGDAGGDSPDLTVDNVVSDMSITANFAVNRSPDSPELISPVEDTVVGQTRVMLFAGGFNDPEGDDHIESRWQIRRAGEADLFYNIISSSDLTEHMTGNILEKGIRYEWRVGYADAGSQQMSWSAWGTFIAGDTVTDENIPPIPPGFSINDYRLMSFLQWPANFSFLNILNAAASAEVEGIDFKFGIYNPLTGNYDEYPGLAIEPGRAYWVLARYGMTLDMEGVFVSTDQDYHLPLLYDEATENGWNMIGVPNDAYYLWFDLEIMETDTAGNILFGPLPVSMLDTGNEYIDKRIWRWQGSGYTSDNSNTYVMEPYSGAWVKAKGKNVVLIFPAASQSGPAAMTMYQGIGYLRSLSGSITPAYADTAGDDSPPMPMSLGDSEVSSGSGCFIKAASDK